MHNLSRMIKVEIKWPNDIYIAIKSMWFLTEMIQITIQLTLLFVVLVLI